MWRIDAFFLAELFIVAINKWRISRSISYIFWWNKAWECEISENEEFCNEPSFPPAVTNWKLFHSLKIRLLHDFHSHMAS